MGGAELLWLVVLAAAFWFLLIRPQRKRQQQVLDTQRAVAVGDEVMTNAGMFGRVTGEVDDPAAGDCLLLEVAPGIEVKIARGAVLKVVSEPVEDDPHDPDGDPHDPEGVLPDEHPTDPENPADDPHRSN